MPRLDYNGTMSRGRPYRHAFRWAAGLFIAGCLLAAGFSSDLRLQIGNAKRTVEEHDRNGQPFYSLSQLSRALGLSLESRGGVARLSGSRGTIVLTSDRPLVRVGDEYVLLSHPVWQRGSGNWYVPVDFLDKVLPSLLDSRLVRTGDKSFEIEAVDQNRVSVQVFGYPDHVSVVFQGSRPATAKVREFHDYLSISFADSLVKPGPIGTPPDRDLVQSIDFASQDAMGAFRIQKGRRFEHYLEHRLDDPPRVVLDIYGTPAVAESVAEPSSSDLPPDRPAPAPTTDRPAAAADSSRADLQVAEGGLVIDPGHGGVDYGVNVSPDVVEKALTLELSELVERKLRSAGERTHLTRNRDVDLDLERRSAVANFYHAGAFITIHAGGAPTSAVRGPVVYVYDPPVEAEADSSQSSRKKIPKGTPALVPWELAQLPYLDDSRRLAGFLQTDLNALFDTRNSVCAAPVAVLAPVQAPAVVIEVGFLTNEKDVALLAKPEFREQVADSIARSLSKFLRSR